MQLYTLNSAFLREDVIDKFTSAIWTERYSKPGDVTLVVDPTPDNISTLAEGTFLALEGSKEVMLLDTQLIENGVLKVTGDSLLGFLRNRAITSNGDWTARAQWFNNRNPTGVMIQLVTLNAIVVDSNGDVWVDDNGLANYNSGGPLNRIPNLSYDTFDNSAPITTMSVPHGPLLDALNQIAETYSLGQKLYLNTASVDDYDLRYMVYQGVDRSEGVQFSPTLDSLTNVKELRSNRDFKTAAYAFAVAEDNGYGASSGVVHLPGTENFIGFDRRTLLVQADDVFLEKIAVNEMNPTIDELNLFYATLEQKARDGLANHTYVKVVDGEVVPQSEFQYGTHYDLGDIVGLRGYSDIVQQARITEYIRAQDSTGERAYPTVSVID